MTLQLLDHSLQAVSFLSGDPIDGAIDFNHNGTAFDCLRDEIDDVASQGETTYWVYSKCDLVQSLVMRTKMG